MFLTGVALGFSVLDFGVCEVRVLGVADPRQRPASGLGRASGLQRRSSSFSKLVLERPGGLSKYTRNSYRPQSPPKPPSMSA